MKSLIVLVIDHDTFKAEEPDGKELTPDFLYEIGKQTNDMEAGIFGYESWIVVHSAGEALINELANRNVPEPKE